MTTIPGSLLLRYPNRSNPITLRIRSTRMLQQQNRVFFCNAKIQLIELFRKGDCMFFFNSRHKRSSRTLSSILSNPYALQRLLYHFLFFDRDFLCFLTISLGLTKLFLLFNFSFSSFFASIIISFSANSCFSACILSSNSPVFFAQL